MQACLIKTFRKANRPMSLAANKAYSSKAIREDIAKLEVEAVTPTRSNETRNDEFDKSTHKKRNIVERAIGWIKEYRRIATRNEKLARTSKRCHTSKRCQEPFWQFALRKSLVRRP